MSQAHNSMLLSACRRRCQPCQHFGFHSVVSTNGANQSHPHQVGRFFASLVLQGMRTPRPTLAASIAADQLRMWAPRKKVVRSHLVVRSRRWMWAPRKKVVTSHLAVRSQLHVERKCPHCVGMLHGCFVAPAMAIGVSSWSSSDRDLLIAKLGEALLLTLPVLCHHALATASVAHPLYVSNSGSQNHIEVQVQQDTRALQNPQLRCLLR